MSDKEKSEGGVGITSSGKTKIGGDVAGRDIKKKSSIKVTPDMQPVAIVAVVALVIILAIIMGLVLTKLPDSQSGSSITTLPPTTTPALTVTESSMPLNKIPALTPIPTSVAFFNVYTDSNVPTSSNAEDNHFYPTGKMGDIDDIEEINKASSDQTHSGTSAIKIVYNARGQGTHICPMGVKSEITCKWAGVYWLNPADNWGTVPNAGVNLEGFKKLTFCARTDPDSAGAQIKFLVGGVGWGVPTEPPFPDSLRPPIETGWQKLTPDWQCFEIDLSHANLSYVIGGFAWVTSWDTNEINESNPKRIVFYLDDIRFER